MSRASKPKSTVSLGLPKGTATIATYSTMWPIRFQEEKKRLEGAFSGYAVSVFHIGSTSIPNLDSKPVIDIAISMEATIPRKALQSIFRSLGYKSHKPRGADEYPWFEYGQEASYFQVYVFKSGSHELIRHLKFCEILAKDDDIRSAYFSLKVNSSKRFANSPDEYAEHKRTFIQDVLLGSFKK